MRPAGLVAISSEFCRMWRAPDLSNVYPPLSWPLPRVTPPQPSKLQWRALKVSFTCHVRNMFSNSRNSVKNSLYSTFCSYKRRPQPKKKRRIRRRSWRLRRQGRLNTQWWHRTRALTLHHVVLEREREVDTRTRGGKKGILGLVKTKGEKKEKKSPCFCDWATYSSEDSTNSLSRASCSGPHFPNPCTGIILLRQGLGGHDQKPCEILFKFLLILSFMLNLGIMGRLINLVIFKKNVVRSDQPIVTSNCHLWQVCKAFRLHNTWEVY